jgi:hypothetical protein
VLAISEADQDMVSLVYSGLMRKTTNGALIPDLAESYTISENAKEMFLTWISGITGRDSHLISIQMGDAFGERLGIGS